MRKVLLFFFSTVLLFAQEGGYTLGEGVQLGETPLYFGGYFSLQYKAQDKSKSYGIDDLALLSYGEYQKFSYMAEVEYKNLYVDTTTPKQSFITRDTTLHVERLYVDYTHDENIFIRAGKYNTPAGFWNLLPINVLRATTSNPYTNKLLFPEFTTGIDFVYTSYSETELQVDVMVQHNDDLDDDYNNYEMDRHYALGITYTHSSLALKLNGGYFHQIDHLKPLAQRYYLMASARYTQEKFELLGEMGYQTTQNDLTTPFAGYIQALYHITPQHNAILRVEHYEDALTNTQDSFALFGYTYRPLYPIAIKGEYQLHSKSNSDELLFSISVLF